MTLRLAIVTALHPIITNDHEFMIVVHDRKTVAHEFITSHHETLPGAHDSMTVVHARMNKVTYCDADDHELMTVSYEFVMNDSVRENFDSSGSTLGAPRCAEARSATGSGQAELRRFEEGTQARWLHDLLQPHSERVTYATCAGEARRPYPESLPPLEYAGHLETRKIVHTGMMHCQNDRRS
jgi:hypothetical protein